MTGTRLTLAVCLIALCAPAAIGGTSFQGLFTHDTDVAYFTFTLANPSSAVLLRTWSYAGGTNADGATIAAGGFEPYLNLYLSDGSALNPGTPGPCGGPLIADPATGTCSDVYYPATTAFPGGVWSPGTYIVVLSLAANLGVGNLSDGFFAEQVLGITAPGNFTCMEGSPGYQGTPATYPTDSPFCDSSTGVPRDGHWALDIVGVDSASQLSDVPEPSTWALSLVAGVALLLRRRYRNSCLL